MSQLTQCDALHAQRASLNLYRKTCLRCTVIVHEPVQLVSLPRAPPTCQADHISSGKQYPPNSRYSGQHGACKARIVMIIHVKMRHGLHGPQGTAAFLPTITTRSALQQALAAAVSYQGSRGNGSHHLIFASGVELTQRSRGICTCRSTGEGCATSWCRGHPSSSRCTRRWGRPRSL